MNNPAEKMEQNNHFLVANKLPGHKTGPAPGLQLTDNRPEAVTQRKLQELANHSPMIQAVQALQKMADNSPLAKQAAQFQAMADQYTSQPAPPIQKALITTGLPDNLSSGIENISGYSMDEVKVHYNSDKPAQLNAYAYTQGTDIHIASGQEQYLPHEAWHVVQQKQARVAPTLRLAGETGINDDPELEREADLMGIKALQMQTQGITPESSYPLSSTLPGTETIQMVRLKVPTLSKKDPISLKTLEDLFALVDAEITKLTTTDKEEDTLGYIIMANIIRWRGQYNEAIEALREQHPGDTAYTIAQITARDNAVKEKMYSVIISLGNMLVHLNKSLEEYTSDKQQKEAQEKLEAELEETYASYGTKEKTPKPKVPKKTKTKQGPIGLGKKWGKYNKDLKYNGQTEFVQYVPSGATTIEKCLASQKLTDAVYNPAKAFWVSDETKYTITDKTGKTKMTYTFTAAGAQSLMEDYLICGSGDFTEDNEEEWTGETAHPDYTIWKTNEIGAYGIGAKRLKDLEPYCTNITAT